jgi:hypothetical protein
MITALSWLMASKLEQGVITEREHRVNFSVQGRASQFASMRTPKVIHATLYT